MMDALKAGQQPVSLRPLAGPPGGSEPTANRLSFGPSARESFDRAQSSMGPVSLRAPGSGGEGGDLALQLLRMLAGAG